MITRFDLKPVAKQEIGGCFVESSGLDFLRRNHPMLVITSLLDCPRKICPLPVRVQFEDISDSHIEQNTVNVHYT